MGDRVLFQVVSGNKFGPVVYGHWSGWRAPEVVSRLAERMKDRRGDVPYASARLVQELIGDDDDNTGFGIWNATKILTADDSHGDAGVVLIDANTFEPTYLGGYLPRSEEDEE